MADEKKKKKLKTINLICNFFMALFFIACVGALFYPYVSNILRETKQEERIVTYDKIISHLDPAMIEETFAQAEEYNRKLAQISGSGMEFTLDDSQMREYLSTFNNTEDGVMGHIEIPCINVNLLIYHTVEESILQTSCGHMPGSSLPTGGKGTHMILTGHRGLTSATLFTNLDKLELGYQFAVISLNRRLIYEIDDIRVVLPTELSGLHIDPNESYCTLVTCTPYGVNSHRLLVRGRQIDVEEISQTEKISYRILVPSDKERTLPLAEMLACLGCVILLIGLIVMIAKGIKKKKRRR